MIFILLKTDFGLTIGGSNGGTSYAYFYPGSGFESNGDYYSVISTAFTAKFTSFRPILCKTYANGSFAWTTNAISMTSTTLLGPTGPSAAVAKFGSNLYFVGINSNTFNLISDTNGSTINCLSWNLSNASYTRVNQIHGFANSSDGSSIYASCSVGNATVNTFYAGAAKINTTTSNLEWCSVIVNSTLGNNYIDRYPPLITSNGGVVIYAEQGAMLNFTTNQAAFLNFYPNGVFNSAHSRYLTISGNTTNLTDSGSVTISGDIIYYAYGQAATSATAAPHVVMMAMYANGTKIWERTIYPVVANSTTAVHKQGQITTSAAGNRVLLGIQGVVGVGTVSWYVISANASGPKIQTGGTTGVGIKTSTELTLSAFAALSSAFITPSTLSSSSPNTYTYFTSIAETKANNTIIKI